MERELVSWVSNELIEQARARLDHLLKFKLDMTAQSKKGIVKSIPDSKYWL